MRTNDDIEAYLHKMELSFEEVDTGMWLINDDLEHINNIVILHYPPVITFRVKLMQAPKEEAKRQELFEKLLVLNAEDMPHGAYALEQDNIVCVDTLQSEHLDFNEFQASVEALSFVITSHYSLLSQYRDGNAGEGETHAQETGSDA